MGHVLLGLEPDRHAVGGDRVVQLPLGIQGVAEVVDNALVLRFKFTARPVKPSWVQREYLKRMIKAFDEKGVKFATGAMVLWTVPSPSSPLAAPADPNAPAEASAPAAATTIAATEIAAAAGG